MGLEGTLARFCVVGAPFSHELGHEGVPLCSVSTRCQWVGDRGKGGPGRGRKVLECVGTIPRDPIHVPTWGVRGDDGCTGLEGGLDHRTVPDLVVGPRPGARQEVALCDQPGEVLVDHALYIGLEHLEREDDLPSGLAGEGVDERAKENLFDAMPNEVAMLFTDEQDLLAQRVLDDGGKTRRGPVGSVDLVVLADL